MIRWLAAAAFLTACGVPQAEHDKVVAERDALQQQVVKLENKTATLDKMKDRREKMRKRHVRKGPDAAKVDAWLAEAGITRESSLQAVIETNHGNITCDLFPDTAPLTVANFVGLAEGKKEFKDPKTNAMVRRPFYDGLVFHRIIKGFMIQGGDPLGMGTGGPGYKFEDEVDNDRRFDKPGQLAMANAGPATNGSQFFVTESAPGHLTGKHTIFGQCDMGTVTKIAAVPTAARNKPVDDVVMKTVRIVRN